MEIPRECEIECAIYVLGPEDDARYHIGGRDVSPNLGGTRFVDRLHGEAEEEVGLGDVKVAVSAEARRGGFHEEFTGFTADDAWPDGSMGMAE